MRARTVFAALGVAAASAGISSLAAPGEAAALTPIMDPQHGIYIGVDLDHADTVALAAGPLPYLLNQPLLSAGVQMDPASVLWDAEHNLVRGQFSDVVTEAAASPNGSVGLALVDPSHFSGYGIAVAQSLG